MRRLVLLTLAAAVGAIGLRAWPFQSEPARLVPAPVVDVPAGSSTTEIAVLAGGCFWGVQGVYQHLKGVTSAVSGYAGGEKRTAEYRYVTNGRTGHAESVQIAFNPREITYGRLLQVFFSVAHDPTQLNRQGPDVGTQYRSAIFPASAEQANVAEAFIKQLDHARVFGRPLVTRIEPGYVFYRAEAEHQDFLTRNPRHPYIVMHDLPKIEDLKRLFPELYRAAPVLVRSR